jgi:hypothetical protein
MLAWALGTPVAFVAIAAVAMRWGGDLRRLGDAAIAAHRALTRTRGWLGMAVVLEAAAATTLLYTLTHTMLVTSTCPPGNDLLHCYRSVHDVRLVPVAALLALAGGGAYLASRLRRSV